MEEKTYSERHKMGVLALSTVILGIVVGLSSVLLSLFLELVEHFFLGFEENTLMPVSTHIAGGQRFLSVLIGGKDGATDSDVFWHEAELEEVPALNAHHQSFDLIDERVYLVK